MRMGNGNDKDFTAAFVKAGRRGPRSARFMADGMPTTQSAACQSVIAQCRS